MLCDIIYITSFMNGKQDKAGISREARFTPHFVLPRGIRLRIRPYSPHLESQMHLGRERGRRGKVNFVSYKKLNALQ